MTSGEKLYMYKILCVPRNIFNVEKIQYLTKNACTLTNSVKRHSTKRLTSFAFNLKRTTYTPCPVGDISRANACPNRPCMHVPETWYEYRTLANNKKWASQTGFGKVRHEPKKWSCTKGSVEEDIIFEFSAIRP